MTALVAIIALDRRRGVDEAALQAAQRAFCEMRGMDGGGRAWLRRGNDVVQAAVLTEAAPDGTEQNHEIDGTTSSWRVLAGSAFGPDGDFPKPECPLRDLDGQFAVVSFDAGSGEVTVATDPLGMTPVFLAVRDGLAYVSTSSLTLAKLLKAEPNRLALQAFLLSGFHFGASTNWEGITRLEPGHAIRFRPGSQVTECYWRPSLDASVRRLPFHQAVDHVIEVAVECFRTRLAQRGETWIDLTGGYDSRLLALLLRRAGVTIRANTRHTRDPDDVAIARRVAARLDIPWHPQPLPAQWAEVLVGMLDSSLIWGDANLEVLQLSRVLWVHRQLGQRLPHLLSGGGGEHLQYAAWKSEFNRAGRSTKVHLDDWIAMRMIKPSGEPILRGDALPAVRQDYRERLSRWTEPYADELNTTQLDLLYAYKSTGHFGAYRAADEGFMRTLVPFYLKDVFLAAISTDHRHRNQHRLMRHMMQRLDPQSAALPTTRGGPAEPWRATNLHRFMPYYAQLGRKAISKLSPKVIGRPVLLSRREFPWAPAANATVLRWFFGGEEPSSASLLSGPLYQADRLDRLLHAAGQPGFTQSQLLGRIVTVELALRAVGTDVD